MTQFNFQPDDPRLTAYALGELDPIERAQVEAMLADSAEARTALEEIRETIGLLSRELTFEPSLTLTMVQRHAVEQAVSFDNGELLGLRAAARRTVVSDSVESKSRWGTIARTATTVAGVAALALAIPYVSRILQLDGPSPTNSELTIASAEPTSGVDTSRTMPHAGMETSELASGSSGPEAISDRIQSRDEGKEAASTIKESLAQITMPEPHPGSEERSDKNAVDLEEDTKPGDFTALSSELSSPEVASVAEATSNPSTVMAGNSTGNEVKQNDHSGDSNDSKSNLVMSGVQASGPALIAQSGQRDGKIDAVELSSLDSGVVESKESGGLEVLAESESRRLSVAAAGKPFNLERMSSGDSKASAALDYESSVQDAYGEIAGSGYAARGESLELRRLDESVGLSKENFARFRNVDEAIRREHEAYEPIVENAFLTPMEKPLSTFSIDVDTASYANMRRFIQQGQLPPANAVRIEELVNYFRYDYPEPADGSPFSVNIDVATCPWNPQNKLARVGLKAKSIAENQRPATNLVFLIDVSGSMAAENKLPLVKQALSVLVSKMGENDQIAIVTYAGEAGLKLNSTSGSQRTAIQQAIDSLKSGGSTNGAAGINIAYDTAIQSFIKGGANRVILCTDGDFNVGVSDDNTLVEIIQEKAASGVFLSVFGFGMGNLKDAKLEKLADKGNGNYGYIDGLGEARKVFGEQLSGTLITVAKDVKMQLEFNISTVGAYRLIGYENRVLAAKDFDDDTKDAGEIGAGHSVTALYEIVPKAAWLAQQTLDTNYAEPKSDVNDDRLFTVKLRHKLPDAETSEKSQDYAAMNSDVQLSDSNVDFRFAAAVASFGMQIRESKFRGNWTLQNVLSIADASLSTDHNGERTEFTDLVRGVMRLKGDSVTDPRLTMHETVAPATLPAELSTNDARIKATVDGKYRRLLKKIEVRSDASTYGEFKDYGQWDGTSYSGHTDLPAGHWVWVYPNWYIWGDAVETANTNVN